MKKATIILITFILNLTLCIGQEAPPREGAIKTENGVLVYYNYQNPFTISLKGDVDLSKRTININGNLFEFTYGVSKQFGETEKEILSNYMKWELDYLEDLQKTPVKTENHLIHHNARLINLWNFTNPIMIDSEYNEKAFYADFYYKQHVYRFSFMAFKGTKEEANNILSEYVENVRFYNDEIDLKRLQEAVRKGVNEY